MGSNESKTVELEFLDASKSIEDIEPRLFALEPPENTVDLQGDILLDPEVEGVPDSVLIGESLRRVTTASGGTDIPPPGFHMLEPPENTVDRVADPFDVPFIKDTVIEEGKPLPILDRAKKLFVDFFDPEAGGLATKEQKRADLVRVMADKLKIPLNVVDENFEQIMSNPRLTNIIKEPTEEQKPTIAFTQSAVEALTFGFFNPDRVIQQEFPLQSVAGSVTGGVAIFLTTGQVLQSLGLGVAATQAGEAGRAIFASAPRFIPPAIIAGTTFATVKGIRETVEQVEKKDINLLKTGKDVMIGFTEGAALGAAGQAVGPIRRVFMGAGIGFAGGKAEGFTNAEAGVQAAIFGFVEVFGGIGRRDVKLKNAAFLDLRNKTAQYLKSLNPGMSKNESVRFANAWFNAQARKAKTTLKEAIQGTKIKPFEKMAQALSKMIKDFKGTKNVNPLAIEAAAINSKPVAEGGLGKKPTKAKLAKDVALPSAIEPLPSVSGGEKVEAIEPDQTQPKDFPPPLLTASQKKRIEKKKIQKEKQEAIDAVPGVANTAKRLIRQHQAEINVASLRTNKFINDIEKVTTKQEREIIVFLIEGTDVPKELGRPDLIEVFNKNKERLMPLAKQIDEHFQAGWKFQQENLDDLTAEQIINYVTHIWDLPRDQPKHFGKTRTTNETANWFMTRNKFLKKRFISTYKEGIKRGLKPKNLDIGSIIRIHDNMMHKTIANNKLIKEIKALKDEHGVPLVERIDLAPDSWVKVENFPALTKVLFIPGDPVRGERVTDELRVLLNEMGIAVGRRLSPTVFGKPSQTAGLFQPGRPPEIKLQKFFTTHTVTHEIGHGLDEILKLGKPFVTNFKDEIYAINRERIKRLSKVKGTIRGRSFKDYAESDEEQIAEFFAFFFTDPKKTQEMAPGAFSFVMKKLRADGVLTKLVDFKFESRAKELVKETSNLLVKLPVAIHPDLVKPLRVIFDQRTSGPITNAYEAINGVLKKMQLSFSLFHHGALGETGIAAIGPGKTAEVTFGFKGAIPFGKVYDAIVKGDFKAFQDLEATERAVERGLQIGATEDIPVKKIQDALNKFADLTKNKALIGKGAQFLASANEVWDKGLWNYYHDTLKLVAFEHLSATTVDFEGNVVAQEEEIAQLINDQFGGQNWANLMISPWMVQRMSWTLLSPDWGVSTVRQGMAFTGAGAIHKRLSKGLRGKLGRKFWMKALFYFGVGINLWNRTNRRRDRQLHPELYKAKEAAGLDGDFMWNNALGHKTHLFMGRNEDGTERYLRWGKQFREVPELIFDDLGVSPLTATRKKVGGKLSPLLQAGSVIMTGDTLSDFRIEGVSDTEGWERVWGTTKFLMLTPLPFAGRDIFQEGQRFEPTDLVFPDSKGMTRAKTKKWFQIAFERKDQNLFQEVFVNAIANELPVVTLMDAAAISLKSERTIELTQMIENIEDIDKALEQTENRKEKVILLRKRGRFLAEQKEIEKIIENSNIYSKKLKQFQREFDLQ